VMNWSADTWGQGTERDRDPLSRHNVNLHPRTQFHNRNVGVVGDSLAEFLLASIWLFSFH